MSCNQIFMQSKKFNYLKDKKTNIKLFSSTCMYVFHDFAQDILIDNHLFCRSADGNFKIVYHFIVYLYTYHGIFSAN